MQGLVAGDEGVVLPLVVVAVEGVVNEVEGPIAESGVLPDLVAGPDLVINAQDKVAIDLY